MENWKESYPYIPFRRNIQFQEDQYMVNDNHPPTLLEKYAQMKEVYCAIGDVKRAIRNKTRKGHRLNARKLGEEQMFALLDALMDHLYNASVTIETGPPDLGAYTQAEQSCRGCYGPCGRCEESPKFKIGDKIRKPKGYSFDGTIMSVFKNSVSEWRVVAELDGNGMMHIFSENQLDKRGVLNKSYLAYCRKLKKEDSFNRFGSFKGPCTDIRNAWAKGIPADQYSFTLIPW